jgi:hypothetical protein
MNIRVSRRTLRWIKRITLGLIVIGATTAGLYLVGYSITPRTAEGRPILFSPAVRAAEMYRAHVVDWAARLDQIDRGLDQLLNGSADLYEQSMQAESAIDQILRLSQEVDLTSAPTALAELRQATTQMSLAYLTAAQTAAAMINAPTVENRQTAQQSLDEARQALTVVRQSRWLTADDGQIRSNKH